MKKFINYILVLAFTFTSCDDFLDTSSPSSISSETVFQTTSITKAALMGVYSKLTDANIYGQKLSVNWQGVSDIESNGTFSVTEYNSSTSDFGAGNFYDDSFNNTTRWYRIFELVELANSTIDGIRNSPILESSGAIMKGYLGEALTMRAMAYFELVRYWGDVPFKSETSRSDLTNVYMEKTNRDEIYAQLVLDLAEAAEYLPWMNAHAEYATSERITKGYAKALLAKVALFAGGWSLRDGNTFPGLDVERHPTIPEQNGYFVGRVKDWRDYYEIAAKHTAEIIGSADNPHALDPEYENIWRTVCRQQRNPYNENLFEVAFGLGNNGDIGSLMGYSVAANTKYGTRGFGGSYVTSTAYYFYSFDPEDERRDVTLSWVGYTGENKEAINTNPLDVKFAKWRIYWMSDAYLSLHRTANSRVSTGVNWILMRYSDVYLMFAEATQGLGNANAAHPVAGMSGMQALEKVRERAFGVGSGKVSSYDPDFFKAIVNERAWEFGCESIRKQDLVRWGLLDEKVEDMKKTLCLMFDNQKPVKIFDKIYNPSDFPQRVFYKYLDSEYIDLNSINFYGDLPADPGGEYLSANWFPLAAAKPETGNNVNYIEWPVRTLLAATGLNPSYDYSSFLGEMQHGSEIQARLNQFNMGNGVCYYRHPFAIFYEDIYESKGFLQNSFGY
ncbi:RagB/SusD family nutrient uptake outer membrane protein [Belliella marina]|uniref:RagB/SusD family nutrient uptake outer membrane protein n=1 Tax=Belliella marina TaxID=1644146 RepID=A0ABW4VKZ6_9BACT